MEPQWPLPLLENSKPAQNIGATLTMFSTNVPLDALLSTVPSQCLVVFSSYTSERYPWKTLGPSHQDATLEDLSNTQESPPDSSCLSTEATPLCIICRNAAAARTHAHVAPYLYEENNSRLQTTPGNMQTLQELDVKNSYFTH